VIVTFRAHIPNVVAHLAPFLAFPACVIQPQPPPIVANCAIDSGIFCHTAYIRFIANSALLDPAWLAFLTFLVNEVGIIAYLARVPFHTLQAIF
jgi:hypothetical protein